MIQRGTLLLLLIFALAAPIPVVLLQRQRSNTFETYSEWESLKTKLSLGVNGAASFVVTPISMVGGRFNGALNLAAWHGHQQVQSKTTWPDAPNVSFSVYGDDKSEVSLFVSDGLGRNHHVVRFSNLAERPSATLTLGPDLTVTDQKTLGVIFRAGHWNQVRLERFAGDMIIYWNERAVGQVPLPKQAARVSVHGNSSSGRLLVDDLVIDGKGVRRAENFDGIFPYGLYSALAIGLCIFYFFLALRLPELALFLAGIITVAGTLGSWHYAITKIYSYPTRLDLGDRGSNIETKDQVLQRLSVQPINTNSRVVLWLGGSQAWGAGASVARRSTFGLLKAKLEEKWSSAFEFINGAIPGGTVDDAMASLETVLRNRKVAAVILTVAVNDSQLPGLPSRLQILLNTLSVRGAKLFLVVEPVEGEASEAVRLAQRQVREFAALRSVAIYDLAADFSRNLDGYQWWDFVHLTDGGAAAAASALAAPLEDFITKVNELPIKN